MLTMRPNPRCRMMGTTSSIRFSGPRIVRGAGVLEILLRHVLERTDLNNAGIVDQHVDRPKLVDDAVDGGAYVGSTSDVTTDREDAAAARLDVTSRARSSSARSRASSTTLAPSAANSLASTRPRPRDPPVMTTTRSSNEMANRSLDHARKAPLRRQLRPAAPAQTSAPSSCPLLPAYSADSALISAARGRFASAARIPRPPQPRSACSAARIPDARHVPRPRTSSANARLYDVGPTHDHVRRFRTTRH